MARAAETVRLAGGFADRDGGPVRLLPHRALLGLRRRRFTPDIVVTGKPMGNGLPLAATAASKAGSTVPGADALFQYLRIESLRRRRMAVLDVIEREGLQENVARVGASSSGADRTQEAVRSHRRCSRPRAVHRGGDGEGRQRARAGNTTGRSRSSTSSRTAVSSPAMRRLRERRKIPAAASSSTA